MLFSNKTSFSPQNQHSSVYVSFNLSRIFGLNATSRVSFFNIADNLISIRRSSSPRSWHAWWRVTSNDFRRDFTQSTDLIINNPRVNFNNATCATYVAHKSNRLHLPLFELIYGVLINFKMTEMKICCSILTCLAGTKFIDTDGLTIDTHFLH